MFGYKKNNLEQQGFEPKQKNIKMADITLNKWQPKKVYNKDSQYDLVLSIRDEGLKQPITVKEIDDDRFEIVSGERRFLAAEALGWEIITAFVIPKEDEPKDTVLPSVQNIVDSSTDPSLSIIESKTPKPKILTCIGDKRIYINSLKEIVNRMNSGGLCAQYIIEELDDSVKISIEIIK